MLDLGHISLDWRDFVDMAVVAIILYRLLLLIKGTRAVSVLYGLLLVILVYFASEEFGLYTLNWLLTNFLSSIFLVIIILFQQDIRKALSEVGAGRFFRSKAVNEEYLNQLIAALETLAKSRTGALVVIQRKVPLGDVLERGVALGAKLSKDLLVTIFYPNTPLHDGAVVVHGTQIVAAGCILPLSAGLRYKTEFGTRHRAAIGITEETDAIALVVSEERGAISLAMNGRLSTSLDEAKLKRILTKALAK